MKKKTLVIGASENPERYSHKAILRLEEKGHGVEALALRKGSVGNTDFRITQDPLDGVDTVTLYVGPRHQSNYYNYICDLNPRRVIFNPGTENAELKELLQGKGIETLEACTLVMLSTNQY